MNTMRKCSLCDGKGRLNGRYEWQDKTLKDEEPPFDDEECNNCLGTGEVEEED